MEGASRSGNAWPGYSNAKAADLYERHTDDISFDEVKRFEI
jgi:hypothetical protein